MNRYLRTAAVAAVLAGGLGSAGCATSGGCNGGCAGGCNGNGGADGQKHATVEDCYRNWVDVSWPARYDYAARESVLAPFSQQVANGHFLDQTIWNWYFESGSDRLTPGGVDRLDAMARTTPAPDPRIYLQTAHDLLVTPDNVDKLPAIREELNARRAATIKRYLASEFGAPLPYEVYVHDAPVPGIFSPFVASAFRGQLTGYKAGIAGGGAVPVGGSSGSGAGGLAPGTGGGSLPAPSGGAGTPNGATPAPANP